MLLWKWFVRCTRTRQRRIAAKATFEMARVLLEDLARVFPGGVTALTGINLEVQAGEILAVVGPSGCGKTTLLRLIAGLDQPTAGRIEIGGRPMRDVRPKDRN